MSKVVEFGKAAQKHKDEKRHQAKEDKVTSIRDQFERAMNKGKKPTPVKDYLKKKRAKKKK